MHRISRNKQTNMAVHVEIIFLQQECTRRTLKQILPSGDKDLHGIDLRLVPVLTYKKTRT